MKIILPSYAIMTPLEIIEDMITMIEKIGRTCYKSEDKITEGSASAFVSKIINSGHHSVIEHANITVKFICDRGVSHELVRHRLASFSQESTRYCDYSKEKFDKQLTFIKPPWVAIDVGEYKTDDDCTSHLWTDGMWFRTMLGIEHTYLSLINAGWKPQEARSILPNSLKTEIVVTANVREWRHILEVRCSPAAHPQMRELMLPLSSRLHTLLPEIFVDWNEATKQIERKE